MPLDTIPTEKLTITFPPELVDDRDACNDYALAAIRQKAAELTVAGVPARFEVWYPDTTAADFDAVEVTPEGDVVTLPPYIQLGQAGA